jgi:RNA polymerase sigma-70 factor (ECF subfamily)
MRNLYATSVRADSAPPACLAAGTGAFRTTRWSVVLRAKGGAPDSAEALETLCRAYWTPLFAYLRRDGHDFHAAQDLTQEFFARLLAGESLAAVHPGKGRFRSFLLAALRHFLANEWDRAHCLKRGGGCAIFSLDAAAEEQREALEPSDHASPTRLFERRWAETVLARVNARLRHEYEAAGQAARFDALKVYLLNDHDPVSYAATAARLGLTESAVKSAIYKLRQRYGDMFRAEIAQTVDDPAEVEAEIRHLLAALSE